MEKATAAAIRPLCSTNRVTISTSYIARAQTSTKAILRQISGAQQQYRQKQPAAHDAGNYPGFHESNSSKTAVPPRVFGKSLVQIPRGEVRPQNIHKNIFRVGGLPNEKIGQTELGRWAAG